MVYTAIKETRNSYWHLLPPAWQWKNNQLKMYLYIDNGDFPGIKIQTFSLFNQHRVTEYCILFVFYCCWKFQPSHLGVQSLFNPSTKGVFFSDRSASRLGVWHFDILRRKLEASLLQQQQPRHTAGQETSMAHGITTGDSWKNQLCNYIWAKKLFNPSFGTRCSLLRTTTFIDFKLILFVSDTLWDVFLWWRCCCWSHTKVT